MKNLIAILLLAASTAALGQYSGGGPYARQSSGSFDPSNVAITGGTISGTRTNPRSGLPNCQEIDHNAITPNADLCDVYSQPANTQVAGTLSVNAPTGTPVPDQVITIWLSTTNAQNFSWNAIYVGSTDLARPTATTGGGKYDYIVFRYNGTSTKWHLLGKNFGGG